MDIRTLKDTIAKKIMYSLCLFVLSLAFLIALGLFHRSKPIFGISDAASVLFTANFTDSLPYSLFKPVATLPLAIFFQLGIPFPGVQQRGYTAAPFNYFM